MPTVPTYSLPQEQERALPGARQESLASPSLLDAGAEQLGALGKGAQLAGSGLEAVAYKMQERENADALFQAEADLKAGYLGYEADVRQNRKGQYAKGLTTDTAAWWKDAISKRVENLGNNEQRRMFSQRASALQSQSLDGISRFEGAQLEVAHDASWQADKANTTNLTAANPTEPMVESGVSELKKFNAYQAARKGLPAEVLQAMNESDVTNLHKQVLQSLVRSNPAEAKTYFEKYKDQIAGTDRAELGEFAEKATAEAVGVRTGGDIWASLGPKGDREPVNLDQMEERARTTLGDNTFALKATISNLRERVTAFDTGRKERDAAIEAAVNSAILSGQPMAAIRTLPEWSMLSGTTQLKIANSYESREAVRASRAAADESRADAAESRSERRLTREGLDTYLRLSDPDVLASVNRNDLINFRTVLGNQLTTDLVHRQDALTKSAEALAAARIDDATFKGLAIGAGLNPDKKGLTEDEKDRLVQVRVAVNAQLAQAAYAAGRPLRPDERAKEAKKAFDDTVRVPGFWSINGEDRPLSALNADEVKKAVVVLPQGSVRLADIPSEFVNQAEEALAKARRTVDRKSVAAMWLLNKGKWRAPQGGQ